MATLGASRFSACYKEDMRREFSAGGVLVRRLRGRWMVAAIRPAGRNRPGLGAAEGQIDPGETAEATAVREVAEETGVRGESLGKLGDVRYVYVWEGERVFKIVSFFLLRYVGGRLGDLPAQRRTRGRRGALAFPRRGAGTARLRRRARDGRERAGTPRLAKPPRTAGALTVRPLDPRGKGIGG